MTPIIAPGMSKYEVAMHKHALEWPIFMESELGQEIKRALTTQPTTQPDILEYQKLLTKVKADVPTLATQLEQPLIDPEKFAAPNYLYIGLAILALFFLMKK